MSDTFRLNPRQGMEPSASFAEAWVQDSFAARTWEERDQRLAAFGSYRPAPVEGYNPFSDTSRLVGYEDSLHRFMDSRSPEETEFVRRRVDELRDRGRRIDESMGWFPRTLAGMIGPEGLLTAPIGFGAPRAGASLGMAAAEVAARGAAVTGGQALAGQVLDSFDLPTGLQGGAEDVAMAALFGAALGGLAGSVSRRSLDAAARRHLDAHARAEGTAPAAREGGDAGMEFHDGQRWREAPRASEAPRTDDAAPPPGARPTGAAPPAWADAAREVVESVAGPEARTEIGSLPPGRRGEADAAVVRLSYSLDAGEAVATARHEGIHALRDLGKLTPEEWAVLRDTAEREGWLARHDVEARWRATYGATPDAAERMVEEAVAEEFARFARGAPAAEGVRAIFAPMQQLMERVRNGMQGRGFTDARAILGDIDAGGIGRRPPTPDGRQPPLDPNATATRFAPGGGYRAVTTDQLPMYGLINNPLPGPLGDSVAGVASDLVQLPGSLMEGNARGIPSRADSVEARAKQASFLYVDAQQRHRGFYYEHMGWDPASAGPLRSRVADLAQRAQAMAGNQVPAGRMTFDQFDREVALAASSPGTHADPAVAKAAAVWRDLYARFEEDGAAAGVLLSARHREASRAALQREQDGRATRLRQIKTAIDGATDPEAKARWEALLNQVGQARDEANLRVTQLEDARTMSEPYVTHRWLRGKVAEDREGLVDVIARHWLRMKGSEGWASPFLRAELAVSHLLRESPADALARVLARHDMEAGTDAAAARASAEARVGAIRRHLAETSPTKLDTEIRSLMGREAQKGEAPELGRMVTDALIGRGLYEPDDENLGKMLREVLGANFAEVDDWRDTARPGSAKSRTIDVPTRDLAPWLDLNQSAGAADYARRMGTAIEMSRKFGDPSMLGRLEQMQIELLRAVDAGDATVAEMERTLTNTRVLRDKLLGTYRIPADPDAWSIRAVRALTNTAVMAQMGGALLANIMDVGRLVQYRGIRNVMGDLMDRASSNHRSWRLGGDEAAKAGAALELELMARTRAIADLTDAGGDRLWVERALDSGAKHMQVLNLVAPWTEQLQRFGGALLQSDMVELSVKRAEGRITQAELRRLAGLGVGEDQARRIAASWQAAGGERHGRLYLANTDAWADGAARDAFRANLASALDSVVTKPGVGDRPNFMSAPLWQTVLLYRGFTMAATQRILMSGLQQRDGRVLSGMLASTGIAWLIQGPAGGDHDKHPVASRERLFSAIERGGAMGILGDVNRTVEMLSGNGVGLRPLMGIKPQTFAKNPSWAQQAGEVLGAGASPWLNLGWAMTSPEATADRAAGAVRRVLPFNNLLYTDWLFSAVAREAGSAMTAAPPPR